MSAVVESFVKSTAIALERLHSLARGDDLKLYAILDACGELRVPEKVLELGPDRSVSLYRGWAERDYWAIAPYLVKVDEPLLEWVVENLWDGPWGMFVVANVELSELRTHFRKFLTVEDPVGEKMYFRFYDPRVLPDFLTTMVQVDLPLFFGPVSYFIIPTGRAMLQLIEANGRDRACAEHV